MAEPEFRRRLGVVDTNVNVNDNSIIDPAPAANKKSKRTQRIITFSVDHSPVQVQILSTQTIYDLVDIICQNATIGQSESVDGREWNVRLLPDGEVYEYGGFLPESQQRAHKVQLADLALEPNVTTMVLQYDYGGSLEYKIYCKEASDVVDPIVEQSLFPRRKLKAAPGGFLPYDTQKVDLNVLFPTLNKWAFQHDRAVELHLFQPGRKQNHGYVQRDDNGVLHMLFLPCRAGKDLSTYLHCFDYASQFKFETYNDCPMYNWYSVVVCPEGHLESLTDQYSRNQKRGFVEMKIAPCPQTIPHFNSVFPKLAALAGYRKDKRVPRGWLTYQNNTLLLCSGTSLTFKSKAPRGTAFDGRYQHEPVDESAILREMDAEITSLHHLFCVAEALLQTS